MIEFSITVDGEKLDLEVDRVLAATAQFPYWVLYSKPDNKGRTECSFYHMDTVTKVYMVDHELTEIKGGDDDGNISVLRQ